jgi:hypothetical protein
MSRCSSGKCIFSVYQIFQVAMLRNPRGHPTLIVIAKTNILAFISPKLVRIGMNWFTCKGIMLLCTICDRIYTFRLASANSLS